MSEGAKLLRAASATHRGRRLVNADAALVDEAMGLFAVSDGLGDEPRSAEAARTALDVVRRAFTDDPSPAHADAAALHRVARACLYLGLVRANRRLYEAVPSSERTGTTFAGAVVRGEALGIAHVGDSRVYLLCRRGLVQLTQDHTVLCDAVWRGMHPEDAEALPDRHNLTRVLGLRPEVRIEPVVETWDPADTLLLCTDGVSDRVEPHVIMRILLAHDDPAVAAGRLVGRAYESGGRDNATAIVVRRSR
jgi:serine/threonine protein phosphatase PrpC